MSTETVKPKKVAKKTIRDKISEGLMSLNPNTIVEFSTVLYNAKYEDSDFDKETVRQFKSLFDSVDEEEKKYLLQFEATCSDIASGKKKVEKWYEKKCEATEKEYQRKLKNAQEARDKKTAEATKYKEFGTNIVKVGGPAAITYGIGKLAEVLDVLPDDVRGVTEFVSLVVLGGATIYVAKYSDDLVAAANSKYNTAEESIEEWHSSQVDRYEKLRDVKLLKRYTRGERKMREIYESTFKVRAPSSNTVEKLRKDLRELRNMGGAYMEGDIGGPTWFNSP